MTHLYKILQRMHGGALHAVSCRIAKNESDELVALCTSPRPPSAHARNHRATRNQKPFGTRRYIVCLYFCLICLGTESHIFHKTIPIRAVKTAIVFRHFNQRFVAFYNYIILHFDINNITFYNTIL